jgi:hypothetical protein
VGAGVVEAEVTGRIGERQRGSQWLVLVDGPLLGGTGHHPIPGELPFHNGVSVAACLRRAWRLQVKSKELGL